MTGPLSRRSALKAGDAAKAFSYATPGIRGEFRDPATFIDMVRTMYSALLTARYVEFLEGAVIARISGQGEETYRVGEMFYEPPGATHEVSKNASQTQPAKLLAMIFAKKGSTLTTPGPAQGPSGL